MALTNAPLTPRQRARAEQIIREHAVRDDGTSILWGSWIDFEGRRYRDLIDRYVQERFDRANGINRDADTAAAVKAERERCLAIVRGLYGTRGAYGILLEVSARIESGGPPNA